MKLAAVPSAMATVLAALLIVAQVLVGCSSTSQGTATYADGGTYTGEWKDDKAPAGAKLFTAADLQQLESEGWDVFTIQYVDYSASDSAGRRLWG